MAVTATLNVSSVQAKLDAWAKSAQGKARMEQTIDRYIDRDVRETQAGSRIITIEWAREMAQDLCGMITANAAGIADSVFAAVSSITPNRPQRGAHGSVTVELSFQDTWLYRPSLQPYIYGGIDNIIVLFEKGYDAHRQIAGYWHGEMAVSRVSRDGLYFISRAVDSFNAAYASLGITATVMGTYA